MKVIIHPFTSDQAFVSGFGVEYDGIRTGWVCSDLETTVEAFVKAASWLNDISSMSEEERAELRKRHTEKS